MIDQYLTLVLEEAERVAEHHDQIAQSAENPYHEYLQYAVLRLFEGEPDEVSIDISQVAGVTVGYGKDEAMYDSWGDDVEWWETVPPQDKRTVSGCFTPTSTKPFPNHS